MIKPILKAVTVILLCFYGTAFAQTAPRLDVASSFAVFSSVGSVSNSHHSNIIGDIGSYSGAVSWNGNANGNVHIIVPDSPTTYCAADITLAYLHLAATTPDSILPTGTLGGGQTLTAGVYYISGNAALSSTLYLDAENNADHVFIIRITGGLTVAPNTKVILKRRALACNVFWQIGGGVDMGNDVSFKGTFICNLGVNLTQGDTIEGRALSLNGNIHCDSVRIALPLGCDPTLTGPPPPAMGTTECFELFSSDGQLTNPGAATAIRGNVGCDTGGTNPAPLFPGISGTVYYNDSFTNVVATDLHSIYDLIKPLNLLYNIRLLYPQQIGYGLILTPHIYLIDSAALITDTLIIDAENNPNAIFVIQVNGNLNVADNAYIRLIDSAKASNIFWQVAGNTTIGNNVVFKGSIIDSGSISVGTGSNMVGRLLTEIGAVTFGGASAILPPDGTGPCGRPIINHPPIATNDQGHLCQNGGTVNIAILANDHDPDANGIYPSIITAPHNGTMTFVNDTIHYTPNLNFNGSDTVMYSICDDGAPSLCDTALVIVKVNPFPAIDAGPDKAICIGDSTDIGVDPIVATTYRWLPADGLTSSVESHPVGSPTVTTTYVLTDSSLVTGCINTDTMVLTVNPLPIANAGSDKSICFNSTDTVGAPAIANYSYLWTPSAGLSSDTDPHPLVLADTNIIYGLLVTDTLTGCRQTDTVAVIVRPLPAANAGADKAICFGESTVIGNDAVAGSTYLWSPNANLSSNVISQPTANPEATTTYTLTETHDGCVKSNSMTVTVNPLPAAVTGPDQTVPKNGTITLGADPVAGNSYAWLPATDLSSAAIANPSATPGATITYTLTETVDATGCKHANTVVITVTEVFAGEFYNAFSPNGDGKNDWWKIPVLSIYPVNKVTILNRWGSEVWTAENYDNKKVVFAGKNKNGEDLPDGTYYYTITYNGEEKHGWVVIKR